MTFLLSLPDDHSRIRCSEVVVGSTLVAGDGAHEEAGDTQPAAIGPAPA